MGEIKGYICSNCNYEKTYFIGVGFMSQKETKLYECIHCNAIKKSSFKNPRCSKCNRKFLKTILDFNNKLECPNCGEREFNFEIAGTWD